MRLSQGFNIAKAILFCLVYSASQHAAADSKTTNTFTVKAKIIQGCTFQNNIYAIVLTGTGLDYTGSVNVVVNCSKGITASLSLGNGLNDKNGQQYLVNSTKANDKIPYDISLNTTGGTPTTKLTHQFQSINDPFNFTIQAHATISNQNHPGDFTDITSVIITY